MVELLGALAWMVRPAAAVRRLDRRASRAQLGRDELGRPGPAGAGMAMGRNNLFRELPPDRDVHDYYAGLVEYPGGIFVNIVHSWVAPNKFNEEYTRLIGTKGGIDFNTGTFSYRPDKKKNDRPFGGGELNNTLLAFAGVRPIGPHPLPSRFARSNTAAMPS